MGAKWVVRVVMSNEQVIDNAIPSLLACLDNIVVHRNDKDGMCFDVLPPLDQRADGPNMEWAANKAATLESFGFNAVVAPGWPSEREGW